MRTEELLEDRLTVRFWSTSKKLGASTGGLIPAQLSLFVYDLSEVFIENYRVESDLDPKRISK